MKLIKYIPEGCKGENPTFSGEVVLRPISFEEKYGFLEELGISVDDKGAVDTKGASQFKAVLKMVAFSKSHYESVSLKKLSTGEEIKSFDEMSTDDDCHMILIEVAGKLIHGFKSGNG